MEKLLFSLGLGLLLISCQNTGKVDEKIKGEDLLKISERGTLLQLKSISEIEKFDASNLDIQDLDQIQIKNRGSISQQDREDISLIMKGLTQAENRASVLDVELMMSNEDIEDGLFVFSIETAQKRVLSVQMYDEEGFELAANNRISLHEGSNYKAINVKSLENGNYLFILKDQEGKELHRKISIEHK